MFKPVRVALRPVDSSDLTRFRKWDRDPEVTEFLGPVFDRHDGVHKWYQRVLRDPCSQIRSVTTRSGHLIGYLLLENISWRSGSGELKICLGEKLVWNRGYGTDAVRALASLAHSWGLNEILVRVQRRHHAAIRCYLKAGFRRVGILRGGRVHSREEMLLMRCRLPVREGISRSRGA